MSQENQAYSHNIYAEDLLQIHDNPDGYCFSLCQSLLMIGEKVALWKLQAGILCWEQLSQSSLNIGNSSWLLNGDFTMFYGVWCENILYRLWKEKPGQQSSHKALHVQSVLPSRCAEAMVAKTCESSQQMFDLTWGPCHEREPMSYTSWMIRHWRLASSET